MEGCFGRWVQRKEAFWKHPGARITSSSCFLPSQGSCRGVREKNVVTRCRQEKYVEEESVCFSSMIGTLPDEADFLPFLSWSQPQCVYVVWKSFFWASTPPPPPHSLGCHLSKHSCYACKSERALNVEINFLLMQLLLEICLSNWSVMRSMFESSLVRFPKACGASFDGFTGSGLSLGCPWIRAFQFLASSSSADKTPLKYLHKCIELRSCRQKYY